MPGFVAQELLPTAPAAMHGSNTRSREPRKARRGSRRTLLTKHRKAQAHFVCSHKWFDDADIGLGGIHSSDKADGTLEKSSI